MISSLRKKKYGEVRRWVVENLDNDVHLIIRSIYDEISDHLEPSSIPQSVLTMAEYSYKSAFVVDQEINLMAMMTELMVECKWK